ncbi:hypothetical protein HPB48_017629 [Haemaphysalis longicornis]|uniref:CCHC-type domain-containing protein n=1 Tax=Haemaphysalis longicornis TaxID=44386 RepID=A0A9J6FLX5_HAELO|nr:hypothetical protein HPB48_017629 [Haemaphysalis longicornis]
MNKAHSGQLEALFGNSVGRLDRHNFAIDETMSSITGKMNAWLADANDRIADLSNRMAVVESPCQAVAPDLNAPVVPSIARSKRNVLHLPKQGHISRDCKQGERRSGAAMSPQCYLCGMLGHISRDCTNID